LPAFSSMVGGATPRALCTTYRTAPLFYNYNTSPQQSSPKVPLSGPKWEQSSPTFWVSKRGEPQIPISLILSYACLCSLSLFRPSLPSSFSFFSHSSFVCLSRFTSVVWIADTLYLFSLMIFIYIFIYALFHFLIFIFIYIFISIHGL